MDDFETKLRLQKFREQQARFEDAFKARERKQQQLHSESRKQNTRRDRKPNQEAGEAEKATVAGEEGNGEQGKGKEQKDEAGEEAKPDVGDTEVIQAETGNGDEKDSDEDDGADEDEEDEDEESEDSDLDDADTMGDVALGAPGWRERFYRIKFGFDIHKDHVSRIVSTVVLVLSLFSCLSSVS